METLPEALGHSAEQSQPPENLHKTSMEETEEKSSVPVLQHFVLPENAIPLQYLSLSFIAQVFLPRLFDGSVEPCTT